MDRVYVMELVRAFQCGHMTRREFVTRAGVAVGGFAAMPTLLAACAASPTNPPPVVETPVAAGDGATPMPEDTPATMGGMGQMVTYPGPDGQDLTGYLALPEGVAQAPGVIVIQEWWGLNDQIKGVADRLASAGYVALAPDLYHGVVTSEPDEARKQVMALDRDAAVAEIGAAGDYLLTLPDVQGSKVGVIGFCMGGMLVLRSALDAKNLGAAVAFYGSPLTAEEVAQVNVPVLGLYGADDTGIAVADVEAMDAAMTDAGATHEIHIYDGAQHAFFNEQRPESYNAEAALDGWQRTLGWLQTYLQGG